MEPELLAAIAGIQPWDLSDVAGCRVRNQALESGLNVGDVPGLDTSLVAVQELQVPSRTGGPAIPIRVYRPASPDFAGGALLMLHGGAFCMGDLGTEHLRCLLYTAQAAITVVSVDYRLAPEHPFPAGFEDCYDVLLWVEAHLAALVVGRTLLGVAGVSAGGALAAGVALRARDQRGPVLAAQLLICPVIDNALNTASMRAGDDALAWQRRPSEQMWQLYLPADVPASGYAAPARAADLAGLPPTFVAVADQDPLRDEAINYGARLLEADVAVDLRVYADTYHVFDLAAPSAGVARRALADQVAFLTSRLGSA